ncbi:MAG: glycine betaine ABC transporter substrate-binding protein [bacterium]
MKSEVNKIRAVALAAALGAGATANAADIIIGVPNWTSVKATAHVLEVVIEDNLGLDVELQTSTNPIVFEAMDSGAMHAHPEVWMPNQQNLHDTFVKNKGTVVMNPNGVAGDQYMCVPKYIAEKHGITSIDDLTNPSVAALFDSNGNGRGEIFIGTPGWASTNIEKIRAKSYGYDQTFDLIEKDETLAYADLANAINAKEPWVGFCYTPHHMFVLHDLHVLTEPPHDESKWKTVQPTDDPAWLDKSSAGVAWPTAYLHVHYAKSLEKSHPQVASLFSKVKLNTDAVSQMTYALAVDKKDASAYAKEWVGANEDLVLSWLQ